MVDGQRTDDAPWLYCKLTNEPKGTGELKMQDSRAIYFEVNSPIWWEFELVRDFMPVQVICKCHKDPIKNVTGYFPEKVKYGVFRYWKASNSQVNSPIWPEFELAQDLCLSLLPESLTTTPFKSEGDILQTTCPPGKCIVAQGQVHYNSRPVRSDPKSNSAEILSLSSLPASLTNVRPKMKSLSSGHHFPYYKFMGDFGRHSIQGFDPICPQILCSLSPNLMIVQIKFDQDLSTGLGYIQVWKCEWWTTTTDERTTDTWFVYYKYNLTLWNFGSG